VKLRSLPCTSSRSPLLALATSLLALTLLMVLGPGSTAAASSTAPPSSGIEGVWSFTGGSVGIQALPDGTFQGTVITPTTFDTCPHPVGEVMWTDIRPQPDGSYWGLHQWFQGEQCAIDLQRGLTAWRVLHRSDGSSFLRVCFSTPGSTSQPTIAPNGTSSGATYGCSDSALISTLPTSHPSSAQNIVLPGNRQCLVRRPLQIHLLDPKNDPIKRVLVTIGRRRIVFVRGKHSLSGTITIKDLPAGTFTLKVRVTTVLGHRFSSSRRYHTCKKKSKRHS
jgi:hypothetical protein